MKRIDNFFEEIIIVLVLLSVIALPIIFTWLPREIPETATSSSYDEGYDAGYEQGYSAGKSDGYFVGYDEARSEYEINPDDEYFSGFSDTSIEIIQNVDANAIDYARENSEWSPEEALWNVDMYLNNKPDVGGYYCSEEEFYESVVTLSRYYEYFYSEMYK